MYIVVDELGCLHLESLRTIQSAFSGLYPAERGTRRRACWWWLQVFAGPMQNQEY